MDSRSPAPGPIHTFMTCCATHECISVSGGACIGWSCWPSLCHCSPPSLDPLCWRQRGRLPQLCRASWQEARVVVAVGPSFLHWVNRSHWAVRWSPIGRPGATHWLATSGTFQLQLRCLGGTSNLGVDMGLHSSSLHANSLKVGALRVASALVLPQFTVVGMVFSSLVRGSGIRGAYRPSNKHEDSRPVALKAAWLRQDRLASSLLDTQNNFPTTIVDLWTMYCRPSETHQID